MNLEERRLMDVVGWLAGGYAFDISHDKDAIEGHTFGIISPSVHTNPVPSLGFSHKAQGFVKHPIVAFKFHTYNLHTDLRSIVSSLKKLEVNAKQIGDYILVSFEPIELGETHRFQFKSADDVTDVVWFRDINAKREQGMFKPAPRARRTFMVEGSGRGDLESETFTPITITISAEGLATPDYMYDNILLLPERVELLRGSYTDDQLLCLYGHRHHTRAGWGRNRETVPLATLEMNWSQLFLDKEFDV